ncbi:MAG: VOC family protein [Planctomycetota bacterium]
MIVPNLMVSDMSRSVAFYRDLLGMTVSMSVDADQGYSPGELRDGAVFAVVEWNDAQLMLQTQQSLAEELPEFAAPRDPSAPPSGTVFFRGYDPASVADRVPAEHHVKGPETTWYGMNELTLRDPDGHLVTLAFPAPGAAPS